MTPEQLDEIENNQAAAMWIGGPTAAFAQDTLTLIKALREAQKERDEARAELEHAVAEGGALYEAKVAQSEAEQERDEARAEAARVRSTLRLLWEEAQDESRCHLAQGHMISQPCREEVDGALKEGD